MERTTSISNTTLLIGETSFKKIVPLLVRISSDDKTTKIHLNALRNVFCPQDGPLHDAPLSDWKDWVERKPEE